MAMLNATASSNVTGDNRLKRGVESFFAGLATWYDNYLTALSRSEEFERLNSMSDAQLENMGLKRENIARHIFRDLGAL